MQAPVFDLVLLFLELVNSPQFGNPPPRLRNGQSFPSGGENKVCGQIRDVIPRNSGRFRKILIRNTNNETQYATDDCRRMTARAKSKLDILASRVLTEWRRGKAVRVLQAWTDQVNTNDPLSLHYEGMLNCLYFSFANVFELGILFQLQVLLVEQHKLLGKIQTVGMKPRSAEHYAFNKCIF